MLVSEEQIERHAEKTMDLLDDLFMRGQIDETQYDARITALEAWCGKQYAILALGRQLANVLPHTTADERDIIAEVSINGLN